ncbi:MAG: hypothetical protein WAM39_23490 [Bryobacteraceae bacterium]
MTSGGVIYDRAMGSGYFLDDEFKVAVQRAGARARIETLQAGVPVAPQEVPIGGPLDEFRCALERGKRCVLRTTVGRNYYVYYDLDPIRGKGRELARMKWMPGILGDWDVSPDGKVPASATSPQAIRKTFWMACVKR